MLQYLKIGIGGGSVAGRATFYTGFDRQAVGRLEPLSGVGRLLPILQGGGFGFTNKFSDRMNSAKASKPSTVYFLKITQ